MPLVVQKYGGTSVGDVERIKNVARRILNTKKQGHELVVVVSAMAGETDKLIRLAQQIAPVPDERELDVLVSTGEQVSIALLAMALKAMELSKERADAVRVALLKKHPEIDAKRIEIVGRGWEEPAGPDSNLNRRVEVQWFTLE